MKKYEVIVEDEGAQQLTEILQSLSFVKQIKQSEMKDAYSLISEEALAEEWMSEEDDELQRMYNK
ncbi:MAG: hypothetical protein ACTHJ5_12240 [Ilyomonas sp.]